MTARDRALAARIGRELQEAITEGARAGRIRVASVVYDDKDGWLVHIGIGTMWDGVQETIKVKGFTTKSDAMSAQTVVYALADAIRRVTERP